ncbi:hypothetical protein CCO03_19350 [Comamonas serinivorans]|uniref:Transmembrane protein n=1 Tax=Comamonas serinivorans TaxID=1082851 RepID=A0A1Y0ESN7_9BURK|nr:hypothetical protein [Comamonas serinivorans]ARU06528.1 hypothetical protein CCO03_19350 [Comamonas serinivorans]
MKRSILAGVAAAALGLLSMGALGAGLYWLAYPVLRPLLGHPHDWQGDGVWPATLLAGMLWALSFPLAGLVHRRLAASGRPPAWRRLSYLAMLWLGAVVAWLLVAPLMTPR